MSLQEEGLCVNKLDQCLFLLLWSLVTIIARRTYGMWNVVKVTHFNGVPLTVLTALIFSIMVDVKMDVSL